MNVNADELVSQAMAALQQGNPQGAIGALRDALSANPNRLDLRHALSVTHLQLGEPEQALRLNQELLDMATGLGEEVPADMLSQVLLTRAAIFEDMSQPAGSEAAYREILRLQPSHPQAQQGLGFLLLSWGRHSDGVAELERHAGNFSEDQEPRHATRKFLDELAAFRREELHPGAFLHAHRESYVEFFDHHANRMAEQGWIAEAARMRREGDRVVPIIAEGARPYAAIRVDIVNPQTGQPGLIGEEPMIVAIEGFEALAHAPVLFETSRDNGFMVWTSSQCPWDQLTIQVRLAGPGGLDELDSVIGDWYSAGFNGSFGTSDRGRFHYISDPESPTPDAVSYQVDCGRAELRAVENLMSRLAVLHAQVPLRHVVIGRGQLPG